MINRVSGLQTTCNPNKTGLSVSASFQINGVSSGSRHASGRYSASYSVVSRPSLSLLGER